MTAKVSSRTASCSAVALVLLRVGCCCCWYLEDALSSMGLSVEDSGAGDDDDGGCSSTGFCGVSVDGSDILSRQDREIVKSIGPL